MAYQPYVGGYAGRDLRDVPLYGPRDDPVGSGMSRRMQQATRAKQALAEAQWKRAQEREDYERRQQEEERAYQRAMYKKSQQGRPGPQVGRGVGRRADTSKMDDYMKAYRMAESLTGPGTSGGSRQMDPNIIARLTGMIGAIGPQGAHEGMMQSGRLMSAQGGAGTSTGEMRARGMGETGIRPEGYSSRPARAATMAPETRGWEFDPRKYQNPRASSILGSRKEGGTIPKTGSYKLHKGELVIAADEVDESMISRLVRRKLLDSGNKSLGSYQDGGIGELFKLAETGDVAAFREILRGEGRSAKEIDEAVRSVAKGAFRKERGKNIQNYLRVSKAFAPESAIEVAGGARGPGVRAGQGPPAAPPPPKQLTSGLVPPERAMVPSAAPRAMTPPIKGPGVHIPRGGGGYPKVSGPRGMLSAGDDIARATSKLPGWLKTLGVAGGLGLGAYGASKMDLDPREEPGAPQGAEGLSKGFESTALVPEGLADMPEAIGGRLREIMGGLTGPIVGGARGFLRGVTGAEDQAPSGDEAAQEPLAGAAGELAGALDEPAAQALSPGSYGVAAARAAEGDFGTRDKPLTLTGELSDIEQAQRDTEMMPMYQEAKRKASKMEKEANMIFSLLEREGSAMKGDVYQDLYKEGERKMKLADKFNSVLERKEKSTDMFLASSQKSMQGIIRDIIREGATESRQMKLEELRQKGRLDVGTVRGYASTLPRLYNTATTGTSSQRALAQEEIANVLKIIAAYREAAATGDDKQRFRSFGDQSGAFAQQFSQMDKATAEAAIQKMMLDLGGAGSSQLGQLLGGQ